MDQAPAGRLIRDSEAPAHAALNQLQATAYEASLPGQRDAAEAASPSLRTARPANACVIRVGKRAAANGLLGYVAERREMIRYPEFRARGWQIGGGAAEAQQSVEILNGLRGRTEATAE